MAGISTSMPQGPELRLLLMGKTGMGKSSAGNIILSQSRGDIAENVFHATGAATSVTKGAEIVTRDIQGRQITVVDTPGTCDTKEDPTVTLKEIASAVEKSVEGFDAFLIVIRYGTRMTPEEHKAIKQLTDLFGEKVFSYTILIFTYAHTFKMDQKRVGAEYSMKAFEEFIHKDDVTGDPGAIGPLVSKFKGGLVLFENLEENPDKRDAMVFELIQKVDELRSKNDGKRYDNHIFQYAREVAAALQAQEKKAGLGGKALAVGTKVADKVFDHIIKTTSCIIL